MALFAYSRPASARLSRKQRGKRRVPAGASSSDALASHVLATRRRRLFFLAPLAAFVGGGVLATRWWR